jgi:hypothetical protein
MDEGHYHVYKRVKWGKKKTPIYRCILPGCTHYVLPEMLENRVAACPVCSKPYVIDIRKTTLKRPHCDNCRTRVDTKHHQEILEKAEEHRERRRTAEAIVERARRMLEKEGNNQ